MKTEFKSEFADFLEERLGAALFELRERSVLYCSLADNYASILCKEYYSAGEFRQALTEIADIGSKLSDMEKRYLFLAGMREHARIGDALSSESFEELFIN